MLNKPSAFDGYPHKSPTGESKLLSTRLPILVSPSLHQLPEQLDNAETLARRPHINMLVHPETVQVLKMRSRIDEHLDWFFRNAGHTKVSTPLLAAGAGGAVARPFETVATEMEGTRLNLRIAPELWLKRLLVGGIGRVYEIGPAFRNEGVDATHNPEFTVCEAYAPFSTLSDLMAMTEDLLRTLNKRLREIRAEADLLTESVVDLHEDAHSHGLFREDFKRLPFIPTIENAIGRKLPNLGDPTVHQSLVDLFSDLSLPLPANANLPRLLDALCALYIEPLCTTPTFIISHPACLSPLSKSHTCPITNQQVALRAELFIDGTEYANMYEEENSPFAQREKFLQQLKYRSIDGEGDGNTDIDESYLEALEWGLPPTGGWGLGVDRLVMLFTGMKRIGDVLPFGTLRNVVGLAQRQK
ncbi:hypothetical protein BT93_L4833 [Corymbia citriodora subsp. variegata]|uniref:Aminoacyl-transfer RNA synthetases class-II family profile domain-containing protein n=1 Tax=Corymbia citriodora subsp. variegata TaxID=360336 RepID=A0A8T0CFM5_CORYI|nr:hypothetical protein BT93_L4833 [Corymbia citriodora subsp. variegata]